MITKAKSKMKNPAPLDNEAQANSLGNKRALGLLIRELLKYKKLLVFVFIALFMAAAITLSFGHTIRLLIDRGLVTGDQVWLDTALEMLLGLIVLLACASFARLTLVSTLAERVIADIRKRVYEKLVVMDPTFYETGSTGELVSRITADTTLIQSIVSSTLPMTVRNLILLVGGVIMLFITSVKLTSFVLIALPFLLLPVIFFGRLIRQKSKKTQDSIAELGANMGESLLAVKSVQAFNAEDRFTQHFNTRVEDAYKQARSQIFSRGFLGSSVIMILFSAVVVVLWLGGYDVIEGRMSAGELTSFVFYAVIVASSIGIIGEFSSSLYRVSGAMTRILEILALTPAIQSKENAQVIDTVSTGLVRFQDVSFSYHSSAEDVVTLNNVNFLAKKGETLAIVGPSGAGKSTIFQMLLRFYDPEQGSVEFDGYDIKDLDLTSLRNHIAYVPQEPDIFSASVRDNLLLGKGDATQEEIEEATKKAKAHDFIVALDGGYDALLGERGCRLSTGQKQRLAIARAYLKNASVLLLDEASSAQDSQNEKEMQDILRELSKDRTVIMIAHRLSTIVHAEQIIVLDKGAVVEAGNHNELVKLKGLYAEMVRQQFSPNLHAAEGDVSRSIH